MLRARRATAVFLMLMGFGYFLQGTGTFTAIPSFMNNDIRWAIVGTLMIIFALILWGTRGAQN